MPDTFDRLGTFVATYNAALCKLLAFKGKACLPFHGEPTPAVRVLAASDGFIVEYHPACESVHEPAIGYDLSTYDLNTLCQFLSGRLLRVQYPAFGKPYEPPTLVPDIPQGDIIPGQFGIMIDPEVRHSLKVNAYGGSPSPPFPAIQVAPLVKYEQGVAQHVVPGRFKIWSPVVDVTTLGRRRLYHWTHADIWWYPDRLNLDPALAPQLAERDILALEVVVGAVEVLSPEEAREDVPRHASEILERTCREFAALLDASGNDEETLHQWLNDPDHRLFLDLDHSKVWSKVPFGKNVSDFVIRCTDGRYKLIEIEPAACRIFQKTGHEPSAQFNHACRQVRDWKQHVREHVHEVRDVHGLEGIYEPLGVVIMGRTRDIDSDESRRRWQDMKNDFDIELFTYDEICERVRHLAVTLRSLGASL
ncbi:MAG: Shedu anti-phage system protein SduA domain-containing protein [Pirellulales bacterium]